MSEIDRLAPSEWVVRWLSLLAREGTVLDVACGFGRHTRLAVHQGHRVVAVDRNEEALSGLASLPRVSVVKADIEGAQWPLTGRRFDAVIVTNYLHRPLFPDLLGAVSDSGLLIYETFARGNEHFGRPSNPEFLLETAELLSRTQPSLRILGYEDVYLDSPKPAMVQRICAAGEKFTWPVTRG
ncbi:MAG TPA: class I SAM-dependent methyltransferase [Burkholderiales bacterium]|nr:class I SAM-dependent methyltransferase [Burkholderiales bacterium]